MGHAARNPDVVAWEDWTREQTDHLWAMTEHQKHRTNDIHAASIPFLVIYLTSFAARITERETFVSGAPLLRGGWHGMVLLGIDVLDQGGKG